MDNLDQQLKRMVTFIEIAGSERSTEIIQKAEEDANSIYGVQVIAERKKINTYYEKMEDRLDKQYVTIVSMLVNKARTRVLNLKTAHLEDVLREVHGRLILELRDERVYRKVLMNTILQCLCMMMERSVGVRVCRKDAGLTRAVLPEALNRFRGMSGYRARVELDSEVYLSEEEIGGVVMYARAGTIKLDNTIRTRLALTRRSVLSFIRNHLFGPNPHRTFTEFY